MLWGKTNKLPLNIKDNKKTRLIIIVFLFFVFFSTRFYNIHRDVISPDAVNWHYRTWQFVNGLKFQQFEKTYQHYHPGVMVMWVTSIPMEIFKQIRGIEILSIDNFPQFHLVAKLSLIFVQAGLLTLVFHLLYKHFDFYKASLMILMIILEPFYAGNSRLYHLDVLTSLFILISLLYGFSLYRNFTYKNAILTGFFISLAFLTKSVAIGLIPFFLFIFTFGAVFKKSSFHRKKCLFLIFGFVITTIIFFPALWVKPLYYINEIFSEGERVGVRGGHDQILFGKEVEDAGILFYPLVFVTKMHIFTLVMFLFAVLSYKKEFVRSVREKKLGLYIFMAVFYIGYLVVMSWPTKKLDRYMIVVFPFMSILSAEGIYYFWQKFLKNNFSKKIFALVSILIYLIPLYSLNRYLFTYTSPIFLNSRNANKIIGQKSFGVGTFELKDYIVSTYGEGRKLGFIDTKPIKAIYPNSIVFDIRTSKVSDYELLVLGVNEIMPEKVFESEDTFVLDSVLTINNLDYWRIYVKEER